MKRRRSIDGSLAEVPDWVLQHVPDDWPVTEPAPEHWGFDTNMWRRVRSHRLWSDARKTWLAEHAPDAGYCDPAAEQRRRWPVVHRAAHHQEREDHR